MAPTWLAAGALTLVLAAPADAMTGLEWRRLPPAERAAYVAGVVDAWYGLVVVQESLGARDRAITVFADVVNCLRDRLLGTAQIVTAVERYVEGNPGLRGKEMPDIVYVAVGSLCR
ncbi:MAG TPA: hypothetical protein VNN07_17630 [Candidatus Tectomicrobia bacterium]|nr:hypothetical protein [Candidatus Tectomicrobia bacterium]